MANLTVLLASFLVICFARNGASFHMPGLMSHSFNPRPEEHHLRTVRFPKHRSSGARTASHSSAEWKRAGPDTEKPQYDDSGWFDRTAIGVFRGAMVKSLGEDVSTEGYPGLMELALKLNRKFPAEETRGRTRTILVSLFPVFIMKLFPLMFAKPFPAFSAKLNAVITALASKWLMGPNELFDVEEEEIGAGWGDGKMQGLRIERCRFLEESGCASVCINTCKVPTQEFFIKDMGIPLSMEPDYDSFECNFKFGKTPLSQQSDPVFTTACFEQCPSRGALRQAHSSNAGSTPRGQAAESLEIAAGGGGGGMEGPDMAAAGGSMSSAEFEAWCDSLAVQGQYDASVPSREEFVRNLRTWLRGK